MEKNTNKLIQQTGSITLYVLMAMLFFIIVLVGMFGYNTNKQKIAQRSETKEEQTLETEEYKDKYDQLYGRNYVTNGMLLHYDGINNIGNRHDSTTAKWKDLSGNNRDGTINGAVWEENGLVFDGIDDWVNCTKIDFTQSITMEAVVAIRDWKPDVMEFMGNWQNGGGGVIAKKVDGFGSNLYIADAYFPRYTGTTIELNKIYTITMTYDGTWYNLYIDGTLVLSDKKEGTIKLPTSNTVMALGTNPVGEETSSHFFNGKFYSARMYKQALSAEEVAHNANIDKQKYKEGEQYAQRQMALNLSGNNNTGGGISKPTTWKNLATSTNNGTLNGPIWQENGLVFDGTDDWVNCGKIDFTKEVTMEVCVSFDSDLSATRYLLGNWQSGGGGIMVTSNVIKCQFYIAGKYYTVSSTITPEPNHVYTIATTFDGNTEKLYVDGILVGTVAASGAIGLPTSNTVVALSTNPSGSNSAAGYHKGKIYAARLYTRSLNANEIKQNYEVDKQYYHMSYPQKEAYGATWKKVFYHNNKNGTVYFADEAEALNCDTANKFSILTYLEKYRREDGKFEFLLEYPGTSGYNRWKQTSNPCTTVESVVGYEPIDISWTARYWGGLCKSNRTTDTFLDGSVNNDNWYYSIGTYKLWHNAMPGPDIQSQEVNLWVRIK